MDEQGVRARSGLEARLELPSFDGCCGRVGRTRVGGSIRAAMTWWIAGARGACALGWKPD